MLPDVGNCLIHRNTYNQCRMHYFSLSYFSWNTSILLVRFFIEFKWKHEDTTYFFAKTFLTLQENVGFLFSLLNFNPQPTGLQQESLLDRASVGERNKLISSIIWLQIQILTFTENGESKNRGTSFDKTFQRNSFAVLSTAEPSEDDNMNESMFAVKRRKITPRRRMMIITSFDALKKNSLPHTCDLLVSLTQIELSSGFDFSIRS